MPNKLLKHVNGWKVLYLMAAEPEYGPDLKARILPLMTGVGPVEAAVSAATLLAGLKAGKSLPDLVVCLGSAGSARLEQGTVHQVSSVSYRDMDASPLGFDKGKTPFLDLPATLDLPLHIPDIPSATLSTGANIVSGDAYNSVATDMVDMETYAVLRVSQHHGVPLIGLRGISDGAAELQHLSDWTEYLHVVDENLAQAVDKLEDAIGLGTLDLGGGPMKPGVR